MTKTNCTNSKNALVNWNFYINNAVQAITSAIPVDNTKPQITEGDLILSQSITPLNANNILEIKVFINYTNMNSELATLAIFQDSNADAIAATCFSRQYNNSWYMSFYMVAGTTSSTTFSVRTGLATSTSGLHINSDGSGNMLCGGVARTVISIFEYSV